MFLVIKLMCIINNGDIFISQIMIALSQNIEIFFQKYTLFTGHVA